MSSTTLEWRSIGAPPCRPAVVTAAGKRKWILFFHLFFIVLIAAAGLLYPFFRFDAEHTVYPASLLLTLTVAWILCSWRLLRGTLFEPYPLFVIMAGLFNGGQALLEVLGLNPEGILKGRVAADTLVRALFLVTAGMACLHAGALLACRPKSGRAPATSCPGDRLRACRMVGWALIAIAAIPTVKLLGSSFHLVLDHGYMGLYRDRGDIALIFVLSNLLTPGIVFLLAGARRNKAIQVFCWSILALNAASNLFLGARGAAATSLVAAAWIFDRDIRRIPRTLIVVLSVSGLIMFSLIRETRNTEGRNRLSVREQIQVLTQIENPFAASISEMGASLVTVTHTLALVPDTRPYDLGVSYLYAIMTVIPNLGWKVHPSVAHGLLSDWLIATVDPAIANSGGGLGFSFIAEAYLNFGWFGGPFWLVVVGFAFAWLCLRADSGDPARHALIGSFLSFFFVFARGEAAIVARGLVWYGLVPYLLVEALAVYRSRKAKS